MYEDAGCAYPCGEEPMGCPGCPDLGRTTPPKTKQDYMEDTTTWFTTECQYCGSMTARCVTTRNAFREIVHVYCNECGEEDDYEEDIYIEDYDY